MARAPSPIYVVRNPVGDIQTMATYRVLNAGTLVEADIYDVQVGGSPLTQPVNVSSLGAIQFFADPGQYDIEITNDAIVTTYEDVQLVANQAPVAINRALVSDGTGFPAAATTTATEIGYVNGVVAPIQQQFGRVASTGIISGGVLSVNGGDNTKFDCTAITAVFALNTAPYTTYVVTSAFTAQTVTNIATQPITYLALDINGVIQQFSSPLTPSQRRTYAFIGALIHTDFTSILTTNQIVASGNNGVSQLHDLMNFIGPLNLTGNKYSANGANLNIDVSAGTVFKFGSNFQTDPTDPHRVSLSAGTAITFRYRTQNGAEGADVTAIVPGSYDNAGTITVVPNNKFTVQRITRFQSGLTRIQYGQTVYDSLNEAVAAISTQIFTTETNIAENGILRGYLVVKQNATNLSTATDAQFVEAQKFGASAGNAGAALTSANIIAALGYTPANKAGDTFTGVVGLPAGTVSLPSLIWNANTSTGFYEFAANRIGFAASGTNVMTLGTNVLIGTTIDTGSHKLQVQGAARVTGTNVTGDGTATATIAVDGAAGQTRDFSFRSAGSVRWLFRVNATAESGSNVGSDWVLLSRTDAGASLNANVLFIKRSTGFIGLSNSSPASPLDIVGAASISTTGAANTWTLRLRDSTTAALGVGGGILFQGLKSAAGAAGNFAGIAGLKENATDDNEQGALVLYTTPSSGTITEAMRITSGQRALIGTTTDDGVSKLQVNGRISAQVYRRNGQTASTIGYYQDGEVTASGGVAYGILSGGTLTATANSDLLQAIAVRNGVVAAGAFTGLNYYALNIDAGSWTKSGAGTIANAYALVTTAPTIGVANWAAYLDGRAVVTSNLMVGTATDDGVNRLQVAGSIRATATIPIIAARAINTVNGTVAQTFNLLNASSADVSYAYIEAAIVTNTAGTHTGALRLGVAQAGTLTEKIRIADSGGYLSGANTSLQLRANTTGCEITMYTNAGAARAGFGRSESASTTYFYTADTDFLIGAGGADAIKITTGQRVLIGTTTDDGVSKLQVAGSILMSASAQICFTLGTSNTAAFMRFINSGNSAVYAGSTSAGAFEVQTTAVTRLHVSAGGNVGFNTTAFGSGTFVIGIANATVVPTTNPSGGGVLYAEAGALKWRGSSGTVTTIAAA